MSGFLATALLLLSIGLLEAGLAPRGPHLRALLALLAIGPVIVYLARGTAWGTRRSVLALFGGLLSAALWYAMSGRVPAVGAEEYFLLAAALGLSAVACGGPATERAQAAGRCDAGSDRGRLAAALSLIAFGFAALVAVRDYLTLWPALGPASERLTRTAASMLHAAARLGPSYSGAWFVVAVALVFVVRAAMGRRTSSWQTAVAVLLLPILPLAATGLGRLAVVSLKLHIPADVVGSRATLFLMLLVPVWLFLRAHPLRRENRPRIAHRLRWVFAALLILGVALLAWSPHVPARAGRVLLDARGDFNLAPLEWGKYGPNADQGASLASLPSYLEARGFSVTVRHEPIDAPVLAEHDVLVVMNPAYQWAPEELAAVWAFVERGGGLLVLGDHTNIRGTMAPLNALLEPSGVRVRFDSAIPNVARWTWYDCMRIHPHPVTRGVRDEADIKVSIGASLDLPLSARPLLTGRDAFSDAGDAANEKGAYLGNMIYDQGERLGDLPLAAVVTHGRGKVIVFGDTSTFQRTAIMNTHEFVARIFTYLATPGVGGMPGALRIVVAVAIVVGALGLLLGGAAVIPVVVVAALLAAFGLLALEARGRVEMPPIGPGARLAWIDLAHGNRVDLHSGEGNGVNGFVDHLYRGQYMPLGMKRFDAAELRGASLYTTIAPSAPFSADERRALREFVEGGGLLVVAAGYEERNGSLGLLQDFGYEIGGTPIGAAHASKVALPGQHVLMHESWPVVHPEGRGEEWVTSWGFPLVVFERIGRGGLLVIGDSKFLCDVKLESRDAFVEANINFLRAALETAWQRIRSGEGT